MTECRAGPPRQFKSEGVATAQGIIEIYSASSTASYYFIAIQKQEQAFKGSHTLKSPSEEDGLSYKSFISNYWWSRGIEPLTS